MYPLEVFCSLIWIRIRTGSGISNSLDPDQDSAKCLDPDSKHCTKLRNTPVQLQTFSTWSYITVSGSSPLKFLEKDHELEVLGQKDGARAFFFFTFFLLGAIAAHTVASRAILQCLTV
jgi:hypothetical protein